MLSSLIVCVLVMGATAFKPPMPFGLKFGASLPPQDEREHCCAPRYFTFSQTTTISSVGSDGDLLIEMIYGEGAYDAISEQLSITLFEDFFNKTERHFKIIDDYKEEVSYLISKNGDEEFCFVDKTDGKFPDECLPSDARFVGKGTLGDRGLVVVNFYYPSEDLTEHSVKTVQEEGCVPVSLVTRTFHPETGTEVSLSHSGVYDFSLGICDPEEYFKPPTICEKESALAEPTPEMLKLRRRKGIFM